MSQASGGNLGGVMELTMTIGGDAAPSASTFDVVNPATGSVVAVNGGAFSGPGLIELRGRCPLCGSELATGLLPSCPVCGGRDHDVRLAGVHGDVL